MQKSKLQYKITRITYVKFSSVQATQNPISNIKKWQGLSENKPVNPYNLKQSRLLFSSSPLRSSAMASSIQEKKNKKRHQNPKKIKTSETLTLKELKTLGSQLLSSRAHINNLPTLLSVLSPSSPLKFSLEALISLQSFFVPLVNEIPSKSLVDPSKEKDPELVYKAWLRARFDEFVNSLIEIAIDSRSEEALKVRIFSLKLVSLGVMQVNLMDLLFVICSRMWRWMRLWIL